MGDFKTYNISIKNNTFKVQEQEHYPDNINDFVTLKNQSDDSCYATDLIVCFYGANYSRLWGRNLCGNSVAYELAKLVAECGISRFNGDYHWSDDVRYAVYWSTNDRKFVPVCIQDFDLVDYDEENFVRGADGVVEFYRQDYIADNFDSDDLVERLCIKVCDMLNESTIIN